MRRCWVLLSVLTFLFVAGTDPGVAKAQTKVEGYPSVGEPSTVTLLSPGSEPRTRLRYVVQPNQKSKLTMAMGMSMNINVGGMAIPTTDVPTMTMEADFIVNSVSASGDIAYSFAFTGMTVETTDPNMQSMFQSFANDIKAIQGTALVTNRGVVKSAKIDLDKVSNAQLKQTMTSAASPMENLSMPLPEEAVGPGARWEVRQSLMSGGMHIVQKGTFELVSLTGQTASMKVTIEQMAPPQSVNFPNLPPGAEVFLQKHAGTGTGTVQLRLDSLIPTSELTQQTSTAMDMKMGGNSQPMTMDMTLKMKIAGK